MLSIVFLLLVASAANAGNIAIGLNSGAYGGLLGSTISQQSTSTSIANSAPIAVAAAPLAVAAAPVAVAGPVLSASPLAVASGIVSVPTATSSQSRVDVINSRPLVSQVVSSVPVNVALSGGYGNGIIDNGLVANAGLVTGNVNAVNSVAYGNVGNGHGYRAY